MYELDRIDIDWSVSLEQWQRLLKTEQATWFNGIGSTAHALLQPQYRLQPISTEVLHITSSDSALPQPLSPTSPLA